MLFEDESMIRDYQAIQKTWFLRGSNASFQPRASIVGSNCWPRLTMKRDTSFGKKMSSTPLKRFFRFFFKRCLATYPTGKLALVLDNARIHHAKLLRPFPKSVCVSGNFMDEIMKHPHAIIDRLCVRL
ncbi:transposase [Paenibacillus larvae]|nr:transposase [Paenibacillus larvae]MDT2238688.1 transposase [Paenibacillus larvae]